MSFLITAFTSLLLGGAPAAAATPAATPAAVAAPAKAGHANLVDDSAYADVLKTYVNADARVDYPGLKANRTKLDEYLKGVAAVSKADFDKAPREAQIAYLVNAYNAYTLETIIDNYPKPVKNEGGLFGGPGNSIKQIKGAWNGKKHKTAIGDVTLDNIEHDNLRKTYQEPLLHMALVCASKGCPPLRTEPYSADKLNDQLEDQARTYLGSKYGLVVKGQSVEVSAIFKWFGGDFTKKYGSAMGFVEKYAPDDKKPIVKLANGKAGYLDYDWTLNEQAPASKKS